MALRAVTGADACSGADANSGACIVLAGAATFDAAPFTTAGAVGASPVDAGADELSSRAVGTAGVAGVGELALASGTLAATA